MKVYKLIRLNMQNVTGRILNRFSKDQALVDEVLPITAQVRTGLFSRCYWLLMGKALKETFISSVAKLQQMLEYYILSLGSLLMIGVLIPWFLLMFPPFILFFFYIQRRYVVISRELKRLEAISRSPVYAHFSQTLQVTQPTIKILLSVCCPTVLLK